MKRLIFLISASLMGCVQSSANREYVPSVNDLSLRMEQNDTEEQVIKKIGYPPTKIEISGCGAALSLQCKNYYYKRDGKTLFIIFFKTRVITSLRLPIDQLPKDESQVNSKHANIEEMWLVNSWRVFNF